MSSPQSSSPAQRTVDTDRALEQLLQYLKSAEKSNTSISRGGDGKAQENVEHLPATYREEALAAALRPSAKNLTQMQTLRLESLEAEESKPCRGCTKLNYSLESHVADDSGSATANTPARLVTREIRPLPPPPAMAVSRTPGRPESNKPPCFRYYWPKWNAETGSIISPHSVTMPPTRKIRKPGCTSRWNVQTQLPSNAEPSELLASLLDRQLPQTPLYNSQTALADNGSIADSTAECLNACPARALVRPVPSHRGGASSTKSARSSGSRSRSASPGCSVHSQDAVPGIGSVRLQRPSPAAMPRPFKLPPPTATGSTCSGPSDTASDDSTTHVSAPTTCIIEAGFPLSVKEIPSVHMHESSRFFVPYSL